MLTGFLYSKMRGIDGTSEIISFHSPQGNINIVVRLILNLAYYSWFGFIFNTLSFPAPLLDKLENKWEIH